MHHTQALLVDAFTEEPLTGNPAGVVPDASGLSRDQMLAVAGELGAAETAFLLPSGTADRRARFFTPTAEGDRSGHATIAGYAHLVSVGEIEPGRHALETNAGVLTVDVDDDETVWLPQPSVEVRSAAVDAETVATALGTDPTLLDVNGLPIGWASTGVPTLIVPVQLLEDLGQLAPDEAAIASLAEAADVSVVYAFSFDTLGRESTLHARAFVPTREPLEEPVTAAASGAAGAYLRHVGAFDGMPEELRFEQGHFVERPGRVRVRVGDRITVGGRAVAALDGTIAVPDLPEDDIIET